MKIRRLLAAVVMALLLFPLAAGSVAGKVFPIGDRLYGMADALFVSAGYAQPSASRPWTAAEARNEMSVLDTSVLDGNQKRLYDMIMEIIGGPVNEELLSVDVELSPEAYFHTNEAYATDEMWAHSFNERKPFATIGIQAGLGPFYTYCELGYGWGRITNKDESESLEALAIENSGGWYGLGAIVPVEDGNLRIITKSDVYSRRFLFNFPAITQIEIDVPRKTFFTLAWDNFSFGIYRGRKQWGTSGIGNFIFDDHVSTLNYATFKVFGRKFAFDYTLMIPAQTYSNSQTELFPAQFRRIFAAHRLDVRLLKNLTFAVSENVMYKFDFPDVDVLNPASIYHNNTNSILLNAIAHMELQYVPVPGFRAFMQFCLDQATAPTEADTQDPAFALSGGLEFVRVMEGGSLDLGLECAWTTPALYRRNSVDFLIWTNNDTNNPYIRYPVFTYLGFRYGGDAIVVSADAEYSMFNGLGFKANATVVCKGGFSMTDSHNRDNDNSDVPNLHLKTPSDPVSVWYIIQLGTEYRTTLFGLPVNCFVDVAWLSGVRGWHGNAGNDLQISLGASIGTGKQN